MQTNELQTGLLDRAKINRLLLACQFDQATAVAQLDPVISTLTQALPTVGLSLLTVESNAWLFCDPQYRVEIKVPSSSDTCIQPAMVYSSIPSINTELQPESLYTTVRQHTTVRQLIATLLALKFDAAIILTQPRSSPYSLAYFLYLSGIPIRVGQSSEFGGSLLSHPIQPLLDIASPIAYHQHLLQAILS